MKTYMRIWIGKEMEGKNKGLLTLFVECANLTPDRISIISDFMCQHNVQAVYLGAGRQNVTIFEMEETSTFLYNCTMNNIKITLECNNIQTVLSYPYIIGKIKQHDILLVERKDLVIETDEELLSHLVYKIDDKKNVYFTNFKVDEYTDIKTVKNGLYDGVDTLIYNETIGGCYE